MPISFKPGKLTVEVAVAVAVGVIGMGLLLLLSGSWEIHQDALKGQVAPEIEFETNDGKPMSISQQKGTVLLLNFWASWCEPCIEELPSLKALENHYAKKGVVVLVFNIEANPENIKGRLAGTEMPSNMIYRFNKGALQPYNVNSIPISILIDRKGIVQEIFYGPQNWTKIAILRQVDKLLK